MSSMIRRLGVTRPTVATFVCVLAITACGSDTTSTPQTKTTAGSGGAAVASGSGTPANRCPLTAEQVTSAVGAAVKGPDSACLFYPVDEAKLRPNVGYVQQVPFACSGTMPAEGGYKEKVEGLGPTAYIAELAQGTRVLVCRSAQPFEITVDAASREPRGPAPLPSRDWCSRHDEPLLDLFIELCRVARSHVLPSRSQARAHHSDQAPQRGGCSGAAASIDLPDSGKRIINRRARNRCPDRSFRTIAWSRRSAPAAWARSISRKICALGGKSPSRSCRVR